MLRHADSVGSERCKSSLSFPFSSPSFFLFSPLFSSLFSFSSSLSSLPSASLCRWATTSPSPFSLLSSPFSSLISSSFFLFLYLLLSLSFPLSFFSFFLFSPPSFSSSFLFSSLFFLFFSSFFFSLFFFSLSLFLFSSFSSFSSLFLPFSLSFSFFSSFFFSLSLCLTGDLVAISVRLVRAADLDADVSRLLVRKLRQHRAEFLELQARDLFVQMLGQHVHADGYFPPLPRASPHSSICAMT